MVYVRPDQCPSLHFALRRKWRTFVYVWVAPCSVDAGNRKRERDIVNSCKFEKLLCCCCCSSLKGSFEGGRAKMVMVGEPIWKANSIEALPFTLTTTSSSSNTCSHHSLVAFVSAATATATATSATASTNHPSPLWCVCIVLATAAAAAVERKREPSPSIVSMS